MYVMQKLKGTQNKGWKYRNVENDGKSWRDSSLVGREGQVDGTIQDIQSECGFLLDLVLLPFHILACFP